MVAHFADTSWFVPINYDTSSTTNFVTVYDEIYCAHYDTTQFSRVDTMHNRAMRFGADTVVIGLIDMPFCELKDSALFDTTYFIVDTTGPTLIDNPNAQSSPYIIDHVFTVCAFQDNNTSGNLIFRIDTNFLFIHEDHKALIKSGVLFLELNFDDSTGWHPVDLNNIDHHNVSYDTGGWHIIRARIMDSRPTRAVAINFSASRMAAPEGFQFPNFDSETWSNIDGLDVEVFWPCSTAFQQQMDPKFIIYLEGIDYFDNYGTTSIYNSRIRNTGLAELRNHGYAFVVVSWKKSKKGLKANAMHVVDLISHLKCTYLDQNSDMQHQFVMIGTSMGGLIGRYALTYMEANPSFSPCWGAHHHNTRLFISIDAPHQGAYVPLGAQELWNAINPVAGFPANMVYRNQSIMALHNSKAVTQLLNYHSTVKIGNTYGPHINRSIFMNDLENLIPGSGGYPQHCKLLAISNGLLTGEQQLGVDNSCIMEEGHSFIDVEAEINMTILGIPYIGLEKEFRLNSTIEAGGVIYESMNKVNKWGISLNWINQTFCLWPFNWPCWTMQMPAGFTVGYVNSTITNDQKTCANVPPYAIAPGGMTAAGSYLPGGLPQQGFNPFVFEFGWDWMNPPAQNGQLPCNSESLTSLDLDIMYGSFDMNATSQGLTFAFMPLKTALDYGGPLIMDIYNDNINTTLGLTPFDVIVGEVNGLPNYPQPLSESNIIRNSGSNFEFPSYNKDHVTIRNHKLPDSLLFNSQFVIEDLWAFYLNREIGDEELFLDNLSMDRDVIIQAEYDISSGAQQNPYYRYPGVNVQPQNVFRVYSATGFNGNNPWSYNMQDNGIFARDEPYTVQSNTITELIAENNINTAGTQILGTLVTTLDTLWVCTIDYGGANKGGENEKIDFTNISQAISVFPNPIRAYSSVFIRLLDEATYTIQVFNAQGILLSENTLEFNQGETVELSGNHFESSGLYIIRSSHLGQSEVFKIIVQ